MEPEASPESRTAAFVNFWLFPMLLAGGAPKNYKKEKSVLEQNGFLVLSLEFFGLQILVLSL